MLDFSEAAERQVLALVHCPLEAELSGAAISVTRRRAAVQLALRSRVCAAWSGAAGFVLPSDA